MKIHNFRELLVWQKSMELADLVYELTTNFPTDERFGLKSQVQRSVVSVPSNIAEGSGRVSSKEFQHFISISMGSLFELETQIELAFRFKYVTENQLNQFKEMVIPIQKMVFGLYNSLNK